MAAISRPVYDFPLSRVLSHPVAKRPPADLRKKRQLAEVAASEHAKRLVPYSPRSKPRTVQALVDMCCCFISNVWAPRTYRLPLKTFIHEVLRRSRVQYPVFQVALCYIMQLKPVIERHSAANTLPAGLVCGRRVFVAALQVASKYLQDRSYSVQSWSKISGLDVQDLKANEIALLCALNWEVHIPYEAYLRCCKRLRMTIDRAHAQVEHPQNIRDHEALQMNVYATPTASPNTPVISAPDALSLATPVVQTATSPQIAVWHHANSM